MTLCMVAAYDTRENPPDRSRFEIAYLTDLRIETDSAGADISSKRLWASSDFSWKALYADRTSSARDFTSTLRAELRPEEFTSANILDKMNKASSVHKKKLCERLVQLRLGITFERFLKAGEQEIPQEVRNRLWYDLERLDFGCQLILFGYLGNGPILFEFDRFGDVEQCDHFAAIGTGSIVAQSVLFQRRQNSTLSREQTLYNLYEAFRLACKANAPGVGSTPALFIVERHNDSVREKLLMSGTNILEKCFNKYGPKAIGKIPQLEDGHFVPLE